MGVSASNTKIDELRALPMNWQICPVAVGAVAVTLPGLVADRK
jgi:hypothetical protein